MTSTVTLVAPRTAEPDPFDPGFWRGAFPDLSIATAAPTPANGPDEAARERARQRMQVEGYFPGEDTALADLAPRLADGVRRLVAMDLPAPFIFMFDEAWNAFHRLHGRIIDHLGPEYRVLPDFWAWHVDPQKGQGGWTPHRDKGRRSLAPDGSPLSLTIWIPLSKAEPLNGCMYMLPRDKDPVYGTEKEDDLVVDLPAVRALPVQPGEFLCWNQAVLHWGAQSSRFAEAPRISMALEFQRADAAPFNQPLLPPLSVLDFPSRLMLIGKQILQYRHMYPLGPRMEALAQRMVQA